MPFLRDPIDQHLFELDLLGWAVSEPQGFYEAQLMNCRIGLAGNGFDKSLNMGALYRWEVNAILDGLRRWIDAERSVAVFRFIERVFEFELRGADFATVDVALREGLDGKLQLSVGRAVIVEFYEKLLKQADNFTPRGREWKETFALHFPDN